MPQWIINDLSIDRQFSSAEEFTKAFKTVLQRATTLNKDVLSCSESLSDRFVTNNQTVHSAITSWGRNSNEYKIALRWLTKPGSKTDLAQSDFALYYNKIDVSNQGLGKAARLRYLDQDARTYSFEGILEQSNPEIALFLLRDGNEYPESINIPNTTDINDIKPTSEPIARAGWEDTLKRAEETFKSLYIPIEQISIEMRRYPFQQGVANSILHILKLLNELSDAHQASSSKVNEWLTSHTHGERCKFSSESPSDPSVFEFPDPLTKQKIRCPWHGKIRGPLQIRVHYEWPIPTGQNFIKVLFIGQKITKW